MDIYYGNECVYGDNESDHFSFTETDNHDTESVRSGKTNAFQSPLLEKEGYYKFKKIVNNKAYKIGFYETRTTPGSLIRNAVTGNINDFLYVGTYHEDIFFKVCNTTIDHKKRIPIILFYESPEEFEKHFKCIVQEDVKTKWRIKNAAAIERRLSNTKPKHSAKPFVLVK